MEPLDLQVMAALFTPPLVLLTSYGIWYAFFREAPLPQGLQNPGPVGVSGFGVRG